MIWHRLDRDKTIDMITRVKGADGSMMFTPVTSEAKCSRLPFLKSFLLYRLTNFSSLPTFSMDYLSNGESYFYMDGSDSALRHLVDMGDFILTPDTVLPFLHFYFCYVRLPEGEMIVLQNAAEASTIDLYDDERREKLDIVPDNYKIAANSNGDGFILTLPLLYDNTPMEVTVTVAMTGQVTLTPQRMLTFDAIQ